MIGLRGKINKKVSFGNPICFCVFHSGVPLLRNNRDPGVDCWWAEAWNASCCPGAASGSAEFTVQSRELSGIDTQLRGVKLSSRSDLCWLSLKPRTAIILGRDWGTPQLALNWFEDATSPITFPCDNNNIEDSLIFSNIRPLTHSYSVWFSVGVHCKHTYVCCSREITAHVLKKREFLLNEASICFW